MCSGPAICGQNVRVSEPGSHQTSAAFAHRLRRMSGRDPHEPHRVATPLELLFDLTFVIAFGVAASEFAHTLVTGHIGAGLAAPEPGGGGGQESGRTGRSRLMQMRPVALMW